MIMVIHRKLMESHVDQETVGVAEPVGDKILLKTMTRIITPMRKYNNIIIWGPVGQKTGRKLAIAIKDTTTSLSFDEVRVLGVLEDAGTVVQWRNRYLYY